MREKDFWIDLLRTYAMVTTLITVVLCVAGSLLMPELTFGYQAFSAPLVYGLAGTLPNLVLYSRHELKIGELLVRKVLQLLLIEAGVFFVALYGSQSYWQRPGMLLVLGGSVLAVYIVANLFSWLADVRSARILSRELMTLQGSLQEEK